MARYREHLGASSSAFILAGALLLMTPGAAGAADWSRYRGPGGSGVSGDGIVTWPPGELWNASIGTGFSSIVVQGGRVYAVGHQEIADGRGTDTVYCFDSASTGADPAPVWTYSYACASTMGNFGGTQTELPSGFSDAGPRATPVTDGVSVYALSLDGFLFCLDAGTGDLVWCRNVEGHLGGTIKVYGCCSSPIIYDDMLFVDAGGTCIAVEKATGEVLWRQAAGGGWCCSVSPVVTTYGSTTAVVFGSRNVAGADVTDGSVLWQHDMGREAMSSHIVSGDTVFYSAYPDTGKSALLTVSDTSAVKEWETTDVMTYHLTNVLYGGYLYVMDNSLTEWEGHDGGDDDADALDSSFKCLDLATGAVQWTKTGIGWATHVVAGDEIVVLKESGQLLRVAATESAYQETGAAADGLIGTWCWTSPALSEGKLYCRNSEGDLVCLELAPAVSVMATDRLALETTDTATFTVSRAAVDVAAELTVSIVLGGTGVKDTDYNLSGGGVTATEITIPAGAASVDVTVTALADADADDEAVTLTVSPGTGYVLASRSSATAYVLNEAMSPPTVDIAATDAWALEGGPDTGSLTVTRSTGDDWPLVVGFTVGGTAQAGDFALRGTSGGEVVISAGERTAVVTLLAEEDANSTDDTVIVTIEAGSAFYTVGSPSSATITIADVDSAATDVDADGMDDEWESCWWGDTASQDADGDPDADDLTNLEEFTQGTDPTAADTDRDGSTDGDEVAAGANPKSPVSFPPPATSNGGGGGCAVSDGLSGGVAALVFLGLVVAALALALGTLVRRRSLD
jgi:outer membrane protein assembly factor BamB